MKHLKKFLTTSLAVCLCVCLLAAAPEPAGSQNTVPGVQPVSTETKSLATFVMGKSPLIVARISGQTEAGNQTEQHAGPSRTYSLGGNSEITVNTSCGEFLIQYNHVWIQNLLAGQFQHN